MATDLLNRLRFSMAELNHNIMMLQVDYMHVFAEFAIVGL